MESFTVGQVVAVKRHGHATIAEDIVTEPGHQFLGRYRVQYPDGGMYYCRPEALRAVIRPPSRVLVCRTTKVYRHAALTYADPEDTVLEVGCHEGITTNLLTARCKWVVGIDKAPDCVYRARKRFPTCNYQLADGFDTDALRALLPQGCSCYSKIFIDISGIADLQSVLSIVAAHFTAFREAYIIVKSQHMYRFMGMASAYEPFGSAADQPEQCDGAADADAANGHPQVDRTAEGGGDTWASKY